MPTVILVLTILPDGEEKWRRFAQDLLEDRLGEYEGLGRHLGIRGLRAYLARTYRQEVIVAYVEAEDPEEAFRRLVASEDPFAEWFKEKLMELHGYDLRRPRIGSSPELIFEHPRAGTVRLLSHPVRYDEETLPLRRIPPSTRRTHRGDSLRSRLRRRGYIQPGRSWRRPRCGACETRVSTL